MLFSQPSSTHIRSSSLKPHQHTSEAHLSSHISIHPKLFSQATSAYIRSSSLKSHQRTWRVMGRPARQKTQTPSLTRRNDRTRHDHAAAPLADCPFVPPFISPHPHKKKSPQAQTPRNSPKTKQHHLPLRSFLSSLSNRSARAFSLNVFTLSSLRPCSIP